MAQLRPLRHTVCGFFSLLPNKQWIGLTIVVIFFFDGLATIDKHPRVPKKGGRVGWSWNGLGLELEDSG